MMKYPGQLKDDYRIARIIEVYPDSKDRVRTVKVTYRRRDKREPKDAFWRKPLIQEVVAVQRLALLQAVREKPPTGGVEDEFGVDACGRIADVKAAYLTLKSLHGVSLFN